MKKLIFLTFLVVSFSQVFAQVPSIILKPIHTATDSVFVINNTKGSYFIKVKTNTGAILGAVSLAHNSATGDLVLNIGGAAYIANLGTQNDFEAATYNPTTGEIVLTANNGVSTTLVIDGSETKVQGGSGITVSGSGTSASPYIVDALDISPTNELQTLGLSGSVLSISGANSLTLPNTSPVLVASNDLMISGGNLQTGATLVKNTETVQNGFSRSFTGGNFGLGTAFPNNVLEVNSGFLDSTGLRFTQVTNLSPKGNSTAYLSVNSLGNVELGKEVSICDLSSSVPSSPYSGGEVLFLGGGTSIPSNFVGYEFDYPTLFANCGFSTNIADYYFSDFQHCTSSTPPTPISVLDATFVQAFLDANIIPDLIVCGFAVNVGDIIYTVQAGNKIVVYFEPSLNPSILNNYVFSDVLGGGCEKQNPVILSTIIPTSGGCYKAQLPTLCEQLQQVQAGSYTGGDSLLMQGGSGCYKVSFSDLPTGSPAATASNGLTKVGNDIRLGGTLNANTDILEQGNILRVLDNTSSPILELNGGTSLAKIQSNLGASVTVGSKVVTQDGTANSSGLRFQNLTSASPNVTGSPLGVNALGDVVKIGSGFISSLNGLSGTTQTFSTINTAAAQGFTSSGTNHALNIRAWDLNGNTGTNQALNFVGTTDAVDLAFRTSNTERMRIYQNGGVGIGTTTPAAKVLSSELSVQTGGFTRVSATHTITGTTGRSEFFAGTSTASGFGAFGYANAGFASPFTGVATAYSYLALSAATDLLIGQNGNAQPMWAFKATTGNTGIGTNNPQVKLDVNGGIATKVRTVTVSGALVVDDHITLIDNGATAFTVTLPAAASFVGRHIIVKRINNTSTGTITINTAGGSVQALAGTLAATTSLAAIGTYGQAAHFISNGTNWYRIN